MGKTTTARNATLDTFRGSLLFLVMVGHLFTAPVTDDPVKWTIYGFHMPLFMALSGYTLNLAALRAMSPGEVAQKYGRRLFLPWLPAFVLFTALSLHDRNLSGLVHATLFPWHHLWYVPALAAFILAAYAVRLSRFGLFALAAAAFVACAAAFGIGRYVGPITPLIDPRLGTMAAFFAFGLWLAEAKLPLRRSAGLGALGASLILVWAALYGAPGALWQLTPYAAMNFALISGLPWVLARKDWRVPAIREIGQDSMFFYLWHPLPMFVLQKALYPHVPAGVAHPLTLAITVAALFAAWAVIRRACGPASASLGRRRARCFATRAEIRFAPRFYGPEIRSTFTPVGGITERNRAPCTTPPDCRTTTDEPRRSVCGLRPAYALVSQTSAMSPVTMRSTEHRPIGPLISVPPAARTRPEILVSIG
jgi:acyltransferase